MVVIEVVGAAQLIQMFLLYSCLLGGTMVTSLLGICYAFVCAFLYSYLPGGDTAHPHAW